MDELMVERCLSRNVKLARGKRWLGICTFVWHLVVVALLMPVTSSALPVYGFADITITDFVVTHGTIGQVENTPRALENGANYGGFNRDDTGSATDPIQAKSGPGPFPSENFFTQQGMNGAYARSDSKLTQAISGEGTTGGQAFSIAEAFLTSKQTSANADVFIRMTQRGIPIVPDDNGVIGISFRVLPVLSISSTGKNDKAEVELDSWFRLSHSGLRVFEWYPCGDATNTSCFSLQEEGGVVQGLTDPFSLNTTIRCDFSRGSPCNDSYRHPFGLFSFDYKVEQGVNDPFELDMRIFSRVSLWNNVPEPGSLVLVVTAFGLLVFILWQPFNNSFFKHGGRPLMLRKSHNRGTLVALIRWPL